MKKRINAYVSISIVFAVILTTISVILTDADTSAYKTSENFDNQITTGSSGIKWNNENIGGNNSGKLKLQSKTSDTKYRVLVPDLLVTPGENYEVIFDYYSESFDGTLEFGVNTAKPKNVWENAKEQTEFNFDNELISGEGTSGKWKKAIFKFFVPEDVGDNNGFGFYYKANPSSIIYIDNVEIKRIKYQFNEFNKKILTGTSAITWCNENIGGNNSGSLKFKSSSEKITYRGRVDGIKLENGIDYTVSFKIYSDNFNGNLNFGIQTNAVNDAWKDAVSQYTANSFDVLEKGNGTSGEWRKVTINFTANFTNEENNSFGFFYKSSPENILYLDDLIIKESSYSVIEFDNGLTTTGSSGFKKIYGETIAYRSTGVLRFQSLESSKMNYIMSVKDDSNNPFALKRDKGYVMSIDYYTGSDYDGSATDLIITNPYNTYNQYGNTDQVEFARFNLVGLDKPEGTCGEWKTATVAFTSPVDVNLGFKMSANKSCTVYFDNLRITEIEKASKIDDKEISISENKEISTQVKSSDEEFKQEITSESVMRYDSVDSNGNPIIKLGHTQLSIVDSGIIFRPSVLGDVCSLTYFNSMDSDNGITNISIMPNNDLNAGSLSLKGTIEGILQLYGKTNFDISYYIILSPVEGTGSVALNSKVFVTNILDIYQKHFNDGDLFYVNNNNLKSWIDGIPE